MPPVEPLLDVLYESIVGDGEQERALALLAERFHCWSASLISFDAVAPQVDFVAAVGSAGDTDHQLSYKRHWAALDPTPQVFAALPSGGVAATGMLFDAEFLRSCAFFHEWYRPMGLEETIGGNLSSRNGHFALIGLHRGVDRRAFTAGEARALEAITPHLARALQLRRTFMQMDTKLKALAESIDRLAAGVIVLGAQREGIHVNRAAREMAARNDGFWLDRSGVPHAIEPEAERALAAMCADVQAGGSGGTVRVPRREGARAYAILAAPLAAGVLAGRTTARRCILLLIHDPDARIQTPPDAIASIFGLPPATARLIAALADGANAKTYAERHHITMDTVNYHLRTAFTRTGLRSQARLLHAVARALAEFSGRARG